MLAGAVAWLAFSDNPTAAISAQRGGVIVHGLGEESIEEERCRPEIALL
jgi:hypothetical protein